ncbi:MAG TPA: flippase [Vulgatibacter sp.]|nr:flippase [Vulgatibacter sp.]
MSQVSAQRQEDSTTSTEADANPASGQPARGKVARSAFHLLSGQVITTVLSILLNSQLGRTLGVNDFGLYFFLLTSTYFAHTFVEWGQGSILMRDVARFPDLTSRLLGSAIVIRTVLAVPATVIGVLVVRGLDYDTRTQVLMALTIVAWIPNSLLHTYGQIFRGHQRMDLDARATVVNKVMHVGIVLAAFGLGGRLVSVILSLGVAGTGALIYSIRQAHRAGFARARVAGESVRHLLREGAPVLVTGVLSHAQLYVETLMLSALAISEVLGWYGAARTITNTLVMPASILITASFPVLSRAASDPVMLREELANALRPVLVLGVLVAAGTALFADVAIGLIYGREMYGPSTTILQLMSVGLFLIFLNMLFGAVAIIVGRTNQAAAIRVVTMALVAGLNWHFIPLSQARWGNGAIGALAASALGELVVLVGTASLVPSGVLRPRMFVDFLRSALSAGVAAFVVLSLPTSTPLVGIPVFLVVFCGMAIATGLLSREDLAALRSVLSRRAG